MIDTDKYEGLTNDGKWRGTDADDSVIYYDAKRDWYATIALVQRDSDHYGNEDNPDMRLMADAPLLLEEVKRLREENDLLASQIRLACEWVEAFHNEGTMISFIEHVYGDEEE
jgi:hypothetical protein|tara:strand:+ start:1338 stop:1676 length:339 start_codon:yes stop_codon:yes gene_type:complete